MVAKTAEWKLATDDVGAPHGPSPPKWMIGISESHCRQGCCEAEAGGATGRSRFAGDLAAVLPVMT